MTTNRTENIIKSLEQFQEAINSLNEVCSTLQEHYDYPLDFSVSRAYDFARNTAQGLTHSMNELRRRTENENSTTD